MGTMTMAPPLVFTGMTGCIRAELFSAERPEQHPESCAAAQTITDKPVQGWPLPPRVLENGQVLVEYYQATVRAIQREQTITPAAEWLIDSFYIVEEQLREICDDLPPAFYGKLSKLASGHLEGYPRVFGVRGRSLRTPIAVSNPSCCGAS